MDRRRGWGEDEDRGGQRKELKDVWMEIGDQEPLRLMIAEASRQRLRRTADRDWGGQPTEIGEDSRQRLRRTADRD